MPRLLFVLKHREAHWGHYGGYHLSSGLRNSVRFIIEMLHLLGIHAKMVEVVDNNCIDREVKHYRPTHVIIEAFWVVPEKFDVLKRLHPHVSWLVRDHSETPFIANEGMFAGWLAGYLRRGVEVTCNAPQALVDLQGLGLSLGHPDLISYTPNYYPVHAPADWQRLKPKPPVAGDTIKVGCFGAIRPLKNHLVQAIAALRYSYALGKKLEFHINSSRIEGGGNPILKNLRDLFANTPRAALVEAPWLEHHEFLDLMRTMDICLQVSFSETFNIVSADAVNSSVPVIASREVPWLGNYAVADANSSTDILNKMLAIHKHDKKARLIWQWRDLSNYAKETTKVWWDRFGFGQHPFENIVPVISAAAEAKKPHHKPKPNDDHHHHPHPPHPPHPYYGDV